MLEGGGMPLGAGLADLCMALAVAVVPAVVGENHGICVLSSLHSTIIQKTPLTFMCLLAFTHVVFPNHTSYVCWSVILKSKILLAGL